MELVGDNSIPKYKWELKRTCFDRLEAIVWACFQQYRSTIFCLMTHLKDIAVTRHSKCAVVRVNERKVHLLLPKRGST